MQQHIQKAVTFLHGSLVFLWKGTVELWRMAMLRKKISIPAGIALIAAIIAGVVFLSPSAQNAAEQTQLRSVTLVRVGDVSQSGSLTTTGEVHSVTEASIAPKVSAPVIGIYHGLGDYVGAGAVIAELENASQRASLAQAQAALARAKSGTTVSGISLEGAIANAESARQSAYSALADAIRHKADEPFSNPDTAQPTFFVSVSNSQLKNTLEAERLVISTILKREETARTTILSKDTVIAELETTQAELVTVRTFLSNLTLALSGAIPNASVSAATITQYQTDANTALSTVTGLQTSATSVVTAIKSAQENLTQGTGNATNADVASAEASVDFARASLENTIIRAPISGTINFINLDQGSFVSAGTSVVRIANNNALEIVTQVSDTDARGIRVGASVSIEGGTTGRVTRMAPAADPVTKKVEVRIGVTNGASLINGGTVSLSIARPAEAVAASTNAPLIVPISALKIGAEDTTVFTVDETDSLVPHVVTLGTLLGERVVIMEGITPDMEIVADARGLKPGQKVLIAP